MTEKQIIETLATKGMEWELGRHAGELFWFEKGLLKTKEKDWNPLQNIADAWQVVEKIKEQTHFFVLSYAEDNEKYAWQADFDDVSVQKIGTGMTVQEAICNAALKVVTLTKR
ncbi:BC1872 family protein [Brevibacillus fortis]|uniref:BC1872 family protein n=1 Tax=Brevibacillus fortis TaxID=2126352 RepID=UPI0038FC0253